MHPDHMLRAMVDDRRRPVIFEAGLSRRGGPIRTGAMLDRIVRLARWVAVSRPARPGQTGPGLAPAGGPHA